MKQSWWQRITLFLVGTLIVVLIQSCHALLSQPSQTQEAVPSNCRVVQHQLGKSCIPLNPQRIVVMDEDSLEILAALGMKPIATARANRTGNKITLLSGKIDTIVELGRDGQPNLEKIVQLNPDLIIGMFVGEQNYKLLSGIAPTVSMDFSHDKWKKTLQQFGEVLNKNQEVEKLLDAYQQRVENLSSVVKQKLGDTKVSIMRFYTTLEFTQFMNHVSFPGSVIEELKFVSIPEIQRQLKGTDETYVNVSLERVDWLDADAIFVALDPGAEKNFQIYESSPLWQTLKAVKNQRVYKVDSGHWVFGSILSANAVLDDVNKYLVQKQNS
ncbi:iron-siderophore ABC transporter substrate-binding protein [Cyanobacteria bacterium FACHB-63]|nr:iron-siderophore ABC transporter substrate-binding protein [Cyanobacteria bacterium FACHB-63]